MSTPKKKVSRPTQLLDLTTRIAQFIKVNKMVLTKDNIPESTRQHLLGQQMAFHTVQILIGQLDRRGSIWRGGYDDNTGVVYADQLSDILK